MLDDPLHIARTLTVVALPILFAICLHEAAHAYAARALGDDTAYRLGRTSLNPLRHIDPFGTLFLPLSLMLLGAPFAIGWAKPVPVRFDRLRHRRRDSALVAAAGPAMNIAQALLAALLLWGVVLVPAMGVDWAVSTLQFAVVFNVWVALFNLLPVLPLDGGRILESALPEPLATQFSRFERFGIVVLLALFILFPLLWTLLGNPGNPVADLIWPVVQAVVDRIMWVTGHDG